MNLVDHTLACIDRALRAESKLTPAVLSVPGFCKAATRHLVNNLCDFPDVNYLEVGVFKGATLFAAAYRNQGTFTGVDNFWFERMSQNRDPRQAFRAAKRRLARSCHVHLVEADSWALDPGRLPPGVDVYFYDGGHSYQDQYQAFTHYDAVLARRFVTLVDDWNWERVRKGTRDAFRELGYEVLLKRELRNRSAVRGAWGNGLLVAVVDRGRRSPRKAAARRASARARGSAQAR
ncbi:MAG TPA: class I SAM-dependent methyltransferase [Vicinamibacteria bacterium]|nr:class I SAM-dependent methyltransferase [Vicinamibacteria bacterium]